MFVHFWCKGIETCLHLSCGCSTYQMG